MLRFFTATGPCAPQDLDGPLPRDTVWIDLLDPDADERAFVRRVTGIVAPTRDELVEIETSSRMHVEDDSLHLSATIVARDARGVPHLTPVGFALTRAVVVTVRFEDLKAFGMVDAMMGRRDPLLKTADGVLVALLEAVVDRLADVLERAAGDLDDVSLRIFGADAEAVGATRNMTRRSDDLRAALRSVGRAGDVASKARASLHGLARIIPYVIGQKERWLTTEVAPRMRILRQDVVSLNEFEAHITDKVQLLLDAALGFASIDQNNIFRILTVVSVVGIPPTLIASMYGMNFKMMPELDWAYGYPYALTMIALSAIAPLIWFKLRGWL
jgi:magnesium transporter